MQLDSSQQAVLEACLPACALSVLGASGSGKSTLLAACVEQIARKYPGARIAVLNADRKATGDLRNSLSRTLGGLPDNISVQSVAAFAFTILSTFAQAVGREEPQLLSGAEQDLILKEIFTLAGGAENAEAIFSFPGLEKFNADAQGLPDFRSEFRDLLMRAAELNLTPADLAQLGEKYHNPIWGIGSEIMAAYEKSLAAAAGIKSANPDRIDHARLVSSAAGILRHWTAAFAAAELKALDMKKPRWDWVLIDDLQNASLSLLTLLKQLQADGSAIVAFGNPDQGVQGFRGGVARFSDLLTRPKKFGGLEAQRFYLEFGYRGGEELQRLLAKISSGIHTAGGGKQRKYQLAAEAAELNDVVEFRSFPNEIEEINYIAQHFRRLHLCEGAPYGQMAVITRSQNNLVRLRQSLVRLGVPVAALPATQPLKDYAVVESLLVLCQIALSKLDDLELREKITPQLVQELLAGKFLTINPGRMRLAIEELRGWEIAQGGSRSSDELICLLARNPQDPILAKVPEFAQAAQLVIATQAAANANPEDALWQIWEAIGLAETWQKIALSSGIAAEVANMDLDVMIQLFRVAQRLYERDPENSNLYTLLEYLITQDVPEDSIARTGQGGDEVTLTTPSASSGKSWQHVVLYGVDEGIWPDTRLRNPLTKVPELCTVTLAAHIAGADLDPQQTYADVIDDELRMLLQAASRAEKSLLIGCLNNEEESPSRFIDWLTSADFVLHHQEESALPLDKESLLGSIYRYRKSKNANLAAGVEAIAEDLQKSGLLKMPASVAELPISTQDPLGEDKWRISPSRTEMTMKCPLRSFFSSIDGARASDTLSRDMGILIHSIAENHPRLEGDYTQTLQVLLDELTARWAELNLDQSLASTLYLRERAEEMLEKYCDYLQNLPDNLQEVYPELRAQYRDKEIEVNAKIDRLEYDSQDPTQVRVVDLKTGKNAPAKDEIPGHPQLRIYQWLVNNGSVKLPPGKEKENLHSVGAALLYINTDAKTIPPREQEPSEEAAIRDTYQLLHEAAQLEKGPNFLAVPSSDNCRSCQFKALCPAQEGERIFS